MEHKEILTNKHIAEDLRSHAKPWGLLVIITVAAFCGFVWHLIYSLRSPTIRAPQFMETVEIIFEIACILLLVGLFIYEAIRFIRLRRVVKKGSYQVLTDTLVTSEDSLDSFSSYDLNEHGYSYYLYFSNFGKYFIGNNCRQFYRWSKLYSMGVRGMMTYATPGDTYYIITDDNKTILYVYNTKLFEYKPDA